MRQSGGLVVNHSLANSIISPVRNLNGSYIFSRHTYFSFDGGRICKSGRGMWFLRCFIYFPPFSPRDDHHLAVPQKQKTKTTTKNSHSFFAYSTKLLHLPNQSTSYISLHRYILPLAFFGSRRVV